VLVSYTIILLFTRHYNNIIIVLLTAGRRRLLGGGGGGGGGLARVSAAADLFIDSAARDVPPLTLNDYPVPIITARGT